MPRRSAPSTPAPAAGPEDASEAPTQGAASVDRALSLLAAFRDGDRALTLSELARRTGLYKSTALRLLASLEAAHLVQRLDEGHYALGTELGRLHRIYSASFSPERAVIPVLRQLVAETGESAAYHIRQGQSRICQFRVDSPHPVRDHIRAGDVLPLTQGTGGRVLVAFDRELSDTLGRQERALYARIRADGYYTAQGDRLAEVAGISAPVFHGQGKLAAALTLTMPVHRYKAAYAKTLLAAARDLSGKLP